MVLYTPISLEEVLKENEKKGEYIQIPFNNGIIEVELTSGSTAKIARIRSNNLNDYLDPKLQPGAELQLYYSK